MPEHKRDSTLVSMRQEPEKFVCEPDFLTGEERLAEALESLLHEDAASLPLLSAADCARYLEACAPLSYRAARPVVGASDKLVEQDFTLCMEIPETNPLRTLARVLERRLHRAAARLKPPPLDPRFHINDFIVQRYQPGSRGITPHVDHIRYQGLVAIVVLSGEGDFALCADRSGSGARPIAAGPGDLLLMRAPGYGGSSRRPFHRLSDIRGERVILGLRWDVKSGEPW